MEITKEELLLGLTLKEIIASPAPVRGSAIDREDENIECSKWSFSNYGEEIVIFGNKTAPFQKYTDMAMSGQPFDRGLPTDPGYWKKKIFKQKSCGSGWRQDVRLARVIRSLRATQRWITL